MVYEEIPLLSAGRVTVGVNFLYYEVGVEGGRYQSMPLEYDDLVSRAADVRMHMAKKWVHENNE